MSSNPQENFDKENFIEKEGKKICLGCAVREGHQHSCFGEKECQCDNAECMMRQGRDPMDNPEYRAWMEVRAQEGLS